ncbi:MAG: CHAT domain-containing protein [Saprospiraceae bacterium]
MSQQPVIFLAFANSQDAYLDMLKRESRIINHALEALEDKQLIKISREESAGIDEIFHNFNRFKGRIAIFHYAGHADGNELHLDGDTFANSAGLADLFGAESALKLVFLNGCSTQGQVENLMDLGVSAVIATSVAINDAKAVEFAEHFYRSLANKNTIKSAFNYASSFLKTKYKNINEPTIEKRKGLKLRREKTGEEMPWGLYINDDADDVLDWTLPTSFVPPAPIRPDENYEVNDYIYPVMDEMVKHEPNLEEELFDRDGEAIDDREYLAKVIENFPWPIGAQIRRLVSNDPDMNKPTMTRLEQITSTYVVTCQLLMYILLAQLWEARKKDENIPNVYFLDALTMNRESFEVFDFISHIKQILQTFKEKDYPLFIGEYEEILKALEAKGDFYNSYLYLESIRSRMSSNGANLESEVYQLSVDAEYALSVILNKAAFLVKYQMITVRDIIIVNPWHKDASFNHYMGRLNAQEGDFLSLFKKPRSYTEFTDSRSVLLVRDLKNLEDYLNLSPFVIDKNAFGDAKATAMDLFMYAFHENDEYWYLVSNQSVYRALEQDADKINTGHTNAPESQSRSRRVRMRGGRSAAAAQSAEKPYGILKEQFEVFKADISKA